MASSIKQTLYRFFCGKYSKNMKGLGERRIALNPFAGSPENCLLGSCEKVDSSISSHNFWILFCIL